jgi:hypothetical protein
MPLAGDRRKDYIIPDIQDKSIPWRVRFINLFILLVMCSFILVVMFISGMVACSFFSGLFGKCVC